MVMWETFPNNSILYTGIEFEKGAHPLRVKPSEHEFELLIALLMANLPQADLLAI